MIVLRWAFLAACLGCLAVVAWNGRWEGRLTVGNHTWIIDLNRSPLWDPPAEPTYEDFEKRFQNTEDFPAKEIAGDRIERVLKSESLALQLLLYLWPVTLTAGLLYLVVRGQRRDLILHCGLSVGIGMTVAAIACFTLWALFGGWGPPYPAFFGGLGLVGGLFMGLLYLAALPTGSA